MVGHETSLSKFKKTEIISSIFSDHNTMRLDINYKEKKTVRNTNTWRLINTFLNNQQVSEDIQREIKKFLETNDNENTTQNLLDAANAVPRGKFIAILPQERRKKSNRQPNFHLTQLEKKEQKTPKISRRK